jgi:hypothetical protein
VARHVHQVRRVAAVEHAEGFGQAQPFTVKSYQPVCNRVECAGPRQPHFLLHFGDDAARAARHFERGAARKGQEEEPLRRAALEDKVGDAVRQGVGLAGTGACNDQERRGARARGLALPRVQLLECVDRPHGRGL